MVNILIWQNPKKHWKLGLVAICWDSVWARKSGSLWCSSLKRQVFVNYHEETICADELFCLQLFLWIVNDFQIIAAYLSAEFLHLSCHLPELLSLLHFDLIWLFCLSLQFLVKVMSRSYLPRWLFSPSLLTSPSLCVSSVWLHGKAGWKREVERYRVSSRAAQYSDSCPERGDLCAVSGPGHLASGLLQWRQRERTRLIQHCGSR